MENTPKIYVCTYAKYNSGSIAGEWLDLTDYDSKEEFYEACKELHKDETDPELMFQDWEYIPAGLISESHLSDKIYQFIESIKDFDEDRQEALYKFVDNFGLDFESDDLIEKFEDAYYGQHDSELDFTYQIIDEIGLLDGMPKHLTSYFNYEAYSRDLFLGDYTYLDGHVFNSNF